MKVLQVISNNDNGGGGIHVLNIFKRELPNFKNELCLIGEGVLEKRCDKDKISYYKINNTVYNNDLIDYINSNKYDIVNFHGAKAVFSHILIKKYIKCKTVVTVHSDYRCDFINNKIKFLLYTPLYKIGLHKFENYICVSQYIMNLLDRDKFKGHKYLVNNGIDLSSMSVQNNCETIRNCLGLTKTAFIYVIAARLHPVKNHKALLKAFSKLAHEYSDAFLLIIGDGNLCGDLKLLTAKLKIEDKALFLGYIDNVTDYINASNINVIVSHNEGGIPPLSILEGFALKRTCIISNFEGIKELLNAKSAFILDANTEKSIYDKMKQAYINKQTLHQMGENSFRILIDKFTIESFCKHYYNIYSMIIENR